MAATDFYTDTLSALDAGGLPFLVGGAYALAHHTGIERPTKDLDLMIRRGDWPTVARTLRAHGIATRLPFPHWLGKARRDGSLIDILFNSGNGLAPVDDEWFARSTRGRILGREVLVTPAEELIWSKAFVMERERFDGADVLHLILARAEDLDWDHLCARFSGHEAVLAAHLTLFAYAFPGEAARVPDQVTGRLRTALDRGERVDPRLCRGTLFSRAQYLADVERGGYRDARRPPYGSMTDREYAVWTAAMSPRRRTTTGGADQEGEASVGGPPPRSASRASRTYPATPRSRP